MRGGLSHHPAPVPYLAQPSPAPHSLPLGTLAALCGEVTSVSTLHKGLCAPSAASLVMSSTAFVVIIYYIAIHIDLQWWVGRDEAVR